MNPEYKFQDETGLASRKRSSTNVHKFTDEYIDWLEQQVKNLTMHNVSNSVCYPPKTHICFSSIKYRYCPHCGKPVQQTDCIT